MRLTQNYQDEDGGMGQGVCDHHKDVEEADVDHHRPEGDDVRHQEQKEKDDPIERFSLKN